MRAGIQQRIQQVAVLLAMVLILLLIWAAAMPEAPAPVAERLSPSPPPAPSATPYPTPAPSTVIDAASIEFPPAGPPRILFDRHNQLLASVRRGDLLMELYLPQAIITASTVISAEARFFNESRQFSFMVLPELQLHGAKRSLKNGWTSATLGGMGLAELKPGSSITIPLQLYVPPEALEPGFAPRLWVGSTFQLASHSRFPRQWWLDIGPIGLNVVPGPPGPPLPLALELDEAGWRLQAMTTTEEIPGPLWGAIRFWNSDMTNTWLPLAKSPDGVWQGGWHYQTPQQVEALVTAPGMAATIISRTLSITSSEQRTRSFSSIEEAEDYLGRPIDAMTQLPPGATLTTIRVESPEHMPPGRIAGIRQIYQLADAVELSVWQPIEDHGQDQRVAVWDLSDSAPDLREVQIGATTGLAAQRLGHWTLHWQLNGGDLRLSAPAHMSLEEILTLARQVR